MPLRVLFFGTPQFAVPTLERILEAGHIVVGVVTQPDKPAGRGHRLTPPPVKELAVRRGIPVFQPVKVRPPELAEQWRALAPDVAVVIAYGRILPKHVLEVPRHGCLNVHASLLPKYRGAAPIQWAVINGETKSGVSIMQMDEGMDTGAVVTTREVDILEDDDAQSLHDILMMTGAELMVEVLAQLERDGSLPSTPQNHDEATMAPLIKREMAQIDWSRDWVKILGAVRGFQPWPKAFTTYSDGELKILGVEPLDPDWLPESAFTPAVPPGMVVWGMKNRGFVVRTGGERGVLLVTRVQPAGKAEMSAVDFMNGGHVDIGAILGR